MPGVDLEVHVDGPCAAPAAHERARTLRPARGRRRRGRAPRARISVVRAAVVAAHDEDGRAMPASRSSTASSRSATQKPSAPARSSVRATAGRAVAVAVGLEDRPDLRAVPACRCDDAEVVAERLEVHLGARRAHGVGGRGAARLEDARLREGTSGDGSSSGADCVAAMRRRSDSRRIGSPMRTRLHGHRREAGQRSAAAGARPRSAAHATRSACGRDRGGCASRSLPPARARTGSGRGARTRRPSR